MGALRGRRYGPASGGVARWCPPSCSAQACCAPLPEIRRWPGEALETREDWRKVACDGEGSRGGLGRGERRPSIVRLRIARRGAGETQEGLGQTRQPGGLCAAGLS